MTSLKPYILRIITLVSALLVGFNLLSQTNDQTFKISKVISGRGTITIDKKPCGERDVIKGDAIIEWGSDDDEMFYARGLTTGKPYVFSKEAFNSKGVRTIKGFLRTGTLSYRATLDIVKSTETDREKFPLKRLAMIVGNSNYEWEANLNNPISDATSVSKKLLSLGFDVITLYDVSLVEFNDAFDYFYKQAGKYEVTLFYYAGHGIQDGNISYLVPCDVDTAYPTCKGSLINVATIEILALNSKCENNLFFIDACRDSKVSWSRGGEEDVKIEVDPGIGLMFSTGKGVRAYDNFAEAIGHSPFADAFLRIIGAPGESLSTAMDNIRYDVIKHTSIQEPERYQDPVFQNRLKIPFYFKQGISWGSILVTSNPQGADIWLNGINTGKVTPAFLDNVTLGSHVVKLTQTGYNGATENVSVTSDKTVTIEMTLSKIGGTATSGANSIRRESSYGVENGHEWVDLGLPSGTKWSTCNIGASIPTSNGNYYAWGETNTKLEYSWESYHFRTSGNKYDNVRFSKYNTDNDRGTVDNKTELDSSDDAAYANWGGKWRMPTNTQWEELMAQCTWSWIGSGYKITGPNGKSITLPAAGYRGEESLYDVGSRGNYWSYCLYTGSTPHAGSLYFAQDKVESGGTFRCYGRSVRPVIDNSHQDNNKKGSLINVDMNCSFQPEGGKKLVLSDTHLMSYSVPVEYAWLTATISSNGLSLSCSANESSSERTAYLTVLSADKVVGIHVIQAASRRDSAIRNDNANKSEINESQGEEIGHEWVNLGLPSGTKWATCNLGASSATENGNYYAWGETSTKAKYSWETYRFRTSGNSYEDVHFSKYNTESWRGIVDNKDELELGDDAAHANWGGKWHMPTKAQWEELKEKCKWSWTGRGYKVTGPNGKYITLPAAGFRLRNSTCEVGSMGFYWSSSLNSGFPCIAWDMHFYNENYSVFYYYYRNYGYSVRPVIE